MATPNITFEQSLDATSVREKMAKIIPAPSAAKIVLAAREVSALLEDEGLPGATTDKEVWQSLQNADGTSKVRTVLRKLFEAANVDLNWRKMHLFERDELLKVLFANFDIQPNAPREMARPEPVQPATPSGWVELILPDEQARTFQLPEEVREILFKGCQPSAEMFETFGTSKCRDNLKYALEEVGATYDASKLQLLPLSQAFEVFTRIFGNFEAASVGAEQPYAGAAGAPRPEVGFAEVEQGGETAVRMSALTREQAQAIYDAARKVRGSGFDVSRLDVYEGMPVTMKDHVDMTEPGVPLYDGCVLVVNPNTDKVVGVGHIEPGLKRDGVGVSPHLIFAAEDLDFEAFERQTRFQLAFVPEREARNFNAADRNRIFDGELYTVPLVSAYHEVPDAETVLCIDFGSSNTTAGTFGVGDDEDRNISLVSFHDVTREEPCLSNLLPTMVYVERCGDGLPPVYKFGYEAQKKLIDHDYIPDASFFYEIKRWVNTMDDCEIIQDEQGNIDKTVKHKDIIFAYLQYVIGIAESQFKRRFKKLHFTAPVKQKGFFVEALGEMFSNTDKQVISAHDSLDEGVAVVYHAAKKALQKDKEKYRNLNVFIMDCGGGTTDLASCQCEYESTDIGDILRLTPGYVNGDSNFGGNNITYRVLQMLKIKIAAKITGNDGIVMQSLIDDDKAILINIDEAEPDLPTSKKNIYSRFQQKYDEAEAVIPTQFAKYKHQNEIERVKRNFYYLWRMAEAIKIEFYKSNLVALDRGDPKIYAGDMGNYYLSVRTSGDAFTRMDAPLKGIDVTIKEVERILCADIYSLLKVLLGGQGEAGKNLLDYCYWMSGQSCRINLFNTLMKEFIPGQNMRRNRSSDTSIESEESDVLKEYCIKGSIEFNRDRHYGDIQPVFEEPDIKHVYTVYFLKGGEKKVMLAPEREINVITRPEDTKNVILEVYDAANNRTNRIKYAIISEPCLRYEIGELAAHFNPMTAFKDTELLDTKVYNKILLLAEKHGKNFICLFALPSSKIYGFNLCQIYVYREDGKILYSIPERTAAYSYENEELLTFFDGNK